jgi:hypothetical protein
VKEHIFKTACYTMYEAPNISRLTTALNVFMLPPVRNVPNIYKYNDYCKLKSHTSSHPFPKMPGTAEDGCPHKRKSPDAEGVPLPMALRERHTWGRTVLKCLVYLHAPMVVQQLVALVAYHPVLGALVVQPVYHVVEYFSGPTKAVLRAFLARGWHGASFDLCDDDIYQDILGTAGFVMALVLQLQCFGGALAMLETLCSSWTRVNLGTSKRCKLMPAGDDRFAYITEGNVMVSRCGIIKILAQAMGCWWFSEQPVGSMMEFHPTEQFILSWTQVFKWGWNMSAFGKDSKKPEWGYSNYQEVEEIGMHALPTSQQLLGSKPEIVKYWLNAAGRKRFAGGSGMKASQVYPDLFGEAVECVFAKHWETFQARAKELHASARRMRSPDITKFTTAKVMKTEHSFWGVANLDDVFEFLLADPDHTRIPML